jgi:hypothetical protein
MEPVRRPGFTRFGHEYQAPGQDKEWTRLAPEVEYTAELSCHDTKVKPTFQITIERGITPQGTFRE